MSKIKYTLLRIAKACLKIIYSLMKILPVQNKITFISRQSDYPNIDFILLNDELKKRYPECKTKILTKQLNNIVSYSIHILVQMYHIVTSRTVILDSYCIPISMLNHRKSLCVIQIWHSMGSMKHFGYAMIGKEEGHSHEIAEIMQMHKNYTYVLISSFDFIHDYIIGFHIEPDKIREIPLPRSDILSDVKVRAERREKVLEKYPELKNKKNILYCPTFRKASSELDREKVLSLIDLIDFEKYNFIYKPHMLSDIRIDDARIINMASEDFDIIFSGDYMISDYSSIIYEAGLLNMPVFLYAYDWEDYKEKRTFNIDLERDIPTLFTSCPEKIINAIEKDEFDYEAYQKFIRKNVKISKKSSCSRIIDLVNIN